MNRNEAISRAIKSEDEAYEVYMVLKEKLSDTNAKKVCEELARAELRHKDLLNRIGTSDLSLIRERIGRLGAYESDSFVEISDEIEPLYLFAIKKEGQAVLRYKHFASYTSGDLQRLFLDLVDEEMEHARILTDELAKYKTRGES